MNNKTAAILLSGLLVGCVQSGPPHAATPTAPSPSPAAASASVTARATKPVRVNHVVTIQAASCRDLLKLSPGDRAAASMFYIGYQASRFRARTINVAVIPSIEAQAVVYCEENPERTAAAAFAQAYLDQPQGGGGRR